MLSPRNCFVASPLLFFSSPSLFARISIADRNSRVTRLEAFRSVVNEKGKAVEYVRLASSLILVKREPDRSICLDPIFILFRFYSEWDKNIPFIEVILIKFRVEVFNGVSSISCFFPFSIY